MKYTYFLGLVTGFCLGGLYFTFPNIIGTFRQPEPPPKSESLDPSIEVVDTYNGCDILRYAPPSGAKYQHFMDCNK